MKFVFFFRTEDFFAIIVTFIIIIYLTVVAQLVMTAYEAEELRVRFPAGTSICVQEHDCWLRVWMFLCILVRLFIFLSVSISCLVPIFINL